MHSTFQTHQSTYVPFKSVAGQPLQRAAPFIPSVLPPSHHDILIRLRVSPSLAPPRALICSVEVVSFFSWQGFKMFQRHTAHVTNRLPESGPAQLQPTPTGTVTHFCSLIWGPMAMLWVCIPLLYTMCKPSRACWRTLCDTICSLKGWRSL